MKRAIITISESGRVNIPNGNVWMSEMELVELFGVTAPTLRAAIKAIYKSGTLSVTTTQRCDLATPASWATFYNLEVVIVLAFRLNTYEASKVRQTMLESLCQRIEKGVNLFFELKCYGNDKSWHILPNNFEPSCRKILLQITEHKIFDYLCKSKNFNLWMVTDIE